MPRMRPLATTAPTIASARSTQPTPQTLSQKLSATKETQISRYVLPLVHAAHLDSRGSLLAMVPHANSTRRVARGTFVALQNRPPTRGAPAV